MSREVVALDLRMYALSHVTTVQQEYNYYLNQWQNYLDLLADVQDIALGKVKTRFEKIRQEEAEARENLMMAFSIIGAVGCAWLGAMIEQAWYPKMFGKVEYVDKIEADIWGRNIWSFGKKIEFSEIIAKTVGDSIHEGAGHILDKLFEKVLPDTKGQMNSNELGSSIRGAQVASFKSSLNIALRSQSSAIIAQLTTLSENINQHEDFGMAVMQVVESKAPRGPKLDDASMRAKGKLLLDEYFDALRQKLADKWFYYGNVPNTGRLPLFVFNFELQAWALWILNQKWEWKEIRGRNARTNLPTLTGFYYTNGEFDLYQIMRALQELAGDEVEELFYGSHDADELAAAEKLSDAADIGEASLSDDSREALLKKDKDKLFAWAKSVPGEIEHPNLDYRRRVIGTIRGMKGVFPAVQ